MWQEASRRDKMAATVVSSIMPAFQVGGKGKESERKEIFPRNPPAAFCFNLIDQNWITGLPLAAREAGKSGTGFSRLVERRAHCLIKCSQSSAKRRKGACLPCPPMPVPRSAVSCPPRGLCISKECTGSHYACVIITSLLHHWPLISWTTAPNSNSVIW